MKREDLFRAVGEVREDQLLEAEKKKPLPWRQYLAAAACLAVVLLLWPRQQQSADQGAEDLDGPYYSTSEDCEAAPNYSVGVEIGELSDPPVGMDTVDSSASLAWLDEDEILAKDTVIFRGTVRNLRYFVAEAGGGERYYTVASVEITDCVRGELGIGDIYNILLPCAPGRTSSIVGDLENLKAGSDAVFMPYTATRETGWTAGSSYFCYADLAELYFSEGIRFLFLDTGDGLSFERNVYSDIADAESLDEVMDWLRDQLA